MLVSRAGRVYKSCGQSIVCHFGLSLMKSGVSTHIIVGVFVCSWIFRLLIDGALPLRPNIPTCYHVCMSLEYIVTGIRMEAFKLPSITSWTRKCPNSLKNVDTSGVFQASAALGEQVYLSPAVHRMIDSLPSNRLPK